MLELLTRFIDLQVAKKPVIRYQIPCISYYTQVTIRASCYNFLKLIGIDYVVVCFVGDSPGWKTKSEVKVSPLQVAQNQALAQVSVFSLLQKQKHPELAHHLIPNIVISPEEFQIFLYDSVNDILVGNFPLKLFDNDKSLYTESVVVLWLVLHYREFCQEILLTDNNGDFHSHFKERAGTKWDVYTRLLKENVSSFPSVTNKVELNQNVLSHSVEVRYKED